MVGDEFTDPVTSRTYVVCFDGSRGQSLQTYDTRIGGQRSGAKDYMTNAATMTIDLRVNGSIHKGSVRGE